MKRDLATHVWLIWKYIAIMPVAGQIDTEMYHKNYEQAGPQSYAFIWSNRICVCVKT